MQDNNEYINFQDFQKLDIRVGKVISSEKVEKSEKLLLLVVDFGDEIGTRQVVSGIAQYFKPEDLIKNNYAFIINLKPRKIFGLDSQAMVLAGDNGEDIFLVECNNMPVGTKIR